MIESPERELRPGQGVVILNHKLGVFFFLRVAFGTWLERSRQNALAYLFVKIVIIISAASNKVYVIIVIF